MNILTLPLRNLASQKLRTVLTILGIAVAVGSFVALTGLTRGLQNSYESGMGDVGGDFIVSQRGTYSLVSSSIAEDTAKSIAAVAGVEEAAAVLLSISEVDEEANIFVTGWPDGSFLWRSLNLEAGALPQDGRDVILGSKIAEALGKSVGDSISIQYEDFRIAGISFPDSVFNQNVAVMKLKPMQDLIGRPDSVSLLQVRLKRPVDAAAADRIRTQLAAAAPNLDVSDSTEFADSMQFVKTIRAIASAVSIVMILASSILVANTLLMSVSERTQEFGILSAIGWTPLRIRLLVVAEGLMMCLLGSIVGVGLGILAMHFVSWLRVSAGLLEPYISSEILAQSIGWVAVLGPLAALYPAWRATRIAPSAAMRGLK